MEKKKKNHGNREGKMYENRFTCKSWIIFLVAPFKHGNMYIR